MKTIAALLFVLAWPAQAGEWFGYPVLGFQIERPSTANGTFFCQDTGELVASPYIRQPLYRHKGVALVGNFNHKSCWVSADEPSYDAVGVSIELNTEYLFK